MNIACQFLQVNIKFTSTLSHWTDGLSAAEFPFARFDWIQIWLNISEANLSNPNENEPVLSGFLWS